ncbi:MAG: hypothetical protein AB7U34_01425 [Novosphingobium sp.]
MPAFRRRPDRAGRFAGVTAGMVSKVTISKKTSDSKARKKPAPISAHKAFPAIVALWFAALLGLGSLVLPVALPERIVTLVHADAVLPALAPPLGLKARMLIAFTALIVGGIVGLMVARRIAQAQRGAMPEAQEVSPARAMRAKLRNDEEETKGRRPFSIRDELHGDDDLGVREDENTRIAEASPANRRRALAIEEDDAPRFTIPDAPLPGAGWPDDLPQHAAMDAESDVETGHEVWPEENLNRQETSQFEDADGPLVLDAFETAASDMDALASDGEQTHPNFGQNVETASPVDQAMPMFSREQPEEEPADDGLEETPHIAFNPLPDMPRPRFATGPRPAVANRPLKELNVVELVERLAYAISTRNALPAENEMVTDKVPEMAPLPAMAPKQSHTEVAEKPVASLGDEAIEALPPCSIPFALRPLVFEPLDKSEYGEDEESDALFSLPSFMSGDKTAARDPVPFKTPATDFGPPLMDEDEDAEEAGDEELGSDSGEADESGMSEAYSSLLALRSGPAVTVRNGFVRVEEPQSEEFSLEPAVVFPGQARQSLSDTEATGDVCESPPRAFNEDREGGEPDFAAQPDVEDIARSRQFDAPIAASEDQKMASPPQDLGETERALRAALANLQRISGAG